MSKMTNGHGDYIININIDFWWHQNNRLSGLTLNTDWSFRRGKQKTGTVEWYAGRDGLWNLSYSNSKYYICFSLLRISSFNIILMETRIHIPRWSINFWQTFHVKRDMNINWKTYVSYSNILHYFLKIESHSLYYRSIISNTIIIHICWITFR